MLLAYAQSILADKRDGYRVMAKAILETCRGAYSEPLNPLRLLQDVKALGDPKHFYTKLIRLKTAELFGAASKLGAVVAKAHSWSRKRAYDYGIHIGMAYQLADDLVDYRLACEGQINVPTALKLAPAVCFLRPKLAPKFTYYIARRKMDQASNLLADANLANDFERHMNVELELARQGATKFPDSPYKPLLLEAPDYLISRMLSQAA